jgi:WD40 repeat protein
VLAAIGFTVRLGIEKEQARASEQRAIANEQKASTEMENARREAAKAMLALAEAAEESGDSEGMRSALGKVPADLRDSIWQYLDERSDSADLKNAPPDGVDWLHVDTCPDDPESVVAVQTNGRVCVVNTNTGQITQLWKAERKGASLFGFSVSEEGKRIALLWVRGASPTADIEVRGLRDGERQGPETIATQLVKELEKGGHGLEIASRFLFVWSKTSSASADLEVWDLNSAQKLWKRGGVQTFRWDAISESLLALAGNAKAERFAAADGAILWSGQANYRFTWNFPRTAEIDCKKNLFLSGSPDARSMRVYDLQSGSLGWENQYGFGSPLSLTREPSGQYVGVLCWRSILGSVFEIRDAANGALIEARPFVNKRASGGKANVRIACSGTAFAIGFPKRILAWRFGKTSPAERTKPYVSRLNFGIMLPMKEGTRVARVSPKPGGSQSELWLSAFGDLERDKNAPLNFPGNGWYAAADAFGERLSVFHPSGNMVAGYQVRGDKLEEVWAPRKMEGAYFALPAPTADRLWAGANVLEFSTGKIVAPLKLHSFEFMRLGVRMEKSMTWVGEEHLAAPVLKAGANADQAQERLLAIWSALTGELLAQGPANQIRSIAASPDGRWVVEGGEDKRVRIRNGRTLEVEHEFRAHERAVTGVVWHPRLPLLVTRDEGRVRIWNTQTWRKEEEFPLDPGDGALHIQGDGTRLSVSDDGRVELYEPESFRR